MKAFGKVLTAMVTPFDEAGQIDLKKTERLIEHLLATGSDTLVITGTTGEGATLTKVEKLSFWEFVIKTVAGQVPVIVSTGTNNTTETLALTNEAVNIGCDACMIVVPYYNKPNQVGIYEHFAKIATSVDIPIMMYNIPSRTGVQMTPETAMKLAKLDNIFAIKEASGDLSHITELIKHTNLNVYSGDDSLTLPALSVGADGVVSVASHIIGEDMQAMINMFLAGRQVKALQLHQQLYPIMKGLFLAPNPVCVKEALRLKGIDVGGVRLPLVALTDDERQALKAILGA